MKSPTQTSTRIPAPETTTHEQWAVVWDGNIDLALVFSCEQEVDAYINRGVEFGQDRARYGKAVCHQIITRTPWVPVR